MDNSPIVSVSQLVRHSGMPATVVGTYHQVDTRMKRHSSPKYVGHAAIRLDDGTDVYLEPIWSKSALRGARERRRFDGRRVAVTGVPLARMPEPAEPVAHLVGPCITGVERIELL
jgi:hypothetical protein